MTPTETQAAPLDRVAVHLRAAQLNAGRAQVLARHDAAQAAEFAGIAGEAARRALVIVTSDLGATMPPIQPGGEAGKEPTGLDLGALASLDTPTARELLTLLEAATVCAERLDAERGRVLPPHIALQPGETTGVDFAESVNELAQRLRGEVFGRTGNGEGA